MSDGHENGQVSDHHASTHTDVGLCTDDDLYRRDIDAFICSSLTVRRRVVSFWRPVPEHFWTALGEARDDVLSLRRARMSVFIVLICVGVIVFVSGLRLNCDLDGESSAFAVFGNRSIGPQRWIDIGHAPDGVVESGVHDVTGANPGLSNMTWHAGWSYDMFQSAMPVFWTIVPSLLGWLIVRCVWVPWAMNGWVDRRPALCALRHLGCVYRYVYIMIAVGALLAFGLTWVAPVLTDRFRWWLWLFLFGESFFVPGVMWIRLVGHDQQGLVFGRHRYVILCLFLMMSTVIPLYAMSIIVF